MRIAKITYRPSEFDQKTASKEIYEIPVEVWSYDDTVIKIENKEKIVCIPWDVIAAIEIDKLN